MGKERKFVGANLSPGTYKLQIRANNSNEGWEQEPIKEIKIIIRPPFYLSIWAFLFYSILLALAVYFSYRIFSIRLRAKNEVRIANLEKEKMEEINKVKMDFFTSVSHELKTPLSLIMAPLKYIYLQTARNLKNDISTSHIPVILLTAKNDTDDIMKGYESGADAYVQKPFDSQILELQVKNIIHIKQVQREKVVNTLGSDVESVPLSKFDKDFISKINELIEQNIDNDEFSIADITQNLYISRSLLHVKMKSLLNISMD